MAMALVRYRFRGRSTVDFFVFMPLSSPEVVLGAALLAMFLTLNINTGFVTIVIAHVMFTVSYVVVTVKARLEGMDRHIEEASMDLGATEWVTFRKITLPMIAPGVAAAAMLAAAISFDDYVITSFNAGQTQTFPLFIFGATRQGVPAEVNVLATMLLIAVLVLMGLNLLIQRATGRTRARQRLQRTAVCTPTTSPNAPGEGAKVSCRVDRQTKSLALAARSREGARMPVRSSLLLADFRRVRARRPGARGATRHGHARFDRHGREARHRSGLHVASTTPSACVFSDAGDEHARSARHADPASPVGRVDAPSLTAARPERGSWFPGRAAVGRPRRN